MFYSESTYGFILIYFNPRTFLKQVLEAKDGGAQSLIVMKAVTALESEEDRRLRDLRELPNLQAHDLGEEVRPRDSRPVLLPSCPDLISIIIIDYS